MPRIRTTTRTLAAALAATLLLAAAVGSASARNISISNQNIRGTFSRLEFVSSLVTVRCPITIEGSFHSRTIPKVFRTLIGAITRVAVKNEACTNGTGAASNLPWHLTYEGFAGALPRITTLFRLLQRFRIQIRTLGISCDYGNETDDVNNAGNLSESGEVVSLAPVAGENITHRVSGTSELCPAVGRMEGSASVFLLNTTTRIRITLI